MADLLYYRLSRRGIEIHGELICARHYAQASAEGGSMAPLEPRELAAGMKQVVTPYTKGDRPCDMCAEEAEIAAGRQVGA